MTDSLPSIQELLDRIARLEAELAGKDQRIAELERIIEELRRRGKRQAAPFSKGAPSLVLRCKPSGKARVSARRNLRFSCWQREEHVIIGAEGAARH